MGAAEREIRALAARAGFATLGAAARAAGVHRKTLVGAARGEKAPTTEIRGRVARVLRIESSLLDRLCAMAREQRSTSP